jgi:DMSO reductase family type II enzyme heme b subunit
MRVPYVSGLQVQALLDPDAAPWKQTRPETVKLTGTPLGLQPTPAILVSWANRKIGAVEQATVAAVHDGQTLAFRIEWSDPTEDREILDTTAFPDAAAIVLPSAAPAPMITMGAPGLAVNAWYWRADEQTGRQVVAEGIGTSRTLDQELVAARGVWKGGRWRVVIARALRVQTNEPVAQLASGETTRYGVAIWEGSQGERAGIKAFSVDWRELSLDAAPTARR